MCYKKQIMKSITYVFLISVGLTCVFAWSAEKEMELRNKLFDSTKYHRLVRPAEKSEVKVGLSLISVNDLDTSAQSMSITGWLTVEWSDLRLNWTKEDYDDVDHVYAVDSEIWRPEIFVDNAATDVDILQNSHLLYRVKDSGHIDWEYPKIFVTSCSIDTTYYPFDTQRCIVEVTSWAYTKEEIELTHLAKTVNVDELGDNGEWIYLGSTVSTKDLKETTTHGTETFSRLDFELVLERRPDFYISNVLLPVVLTSFLTILVFFLPSDSGEKVSYSLTILLAMAVLLTLIADSMPNTSNHISVLSVYLAFCLCIGVLGVFLSVVVLRMHLKDSEKAQPVPAWLQRMTNRLFLPVGSLSCCCCCCCKKKHDKVATIKITPADEISNTPTVHPVSVNEEEYSWKETADIFDWFLMVIFFFVLTTSTVIFMVALVVGGAATAHVV